MIAGLRDWLLDTNVVSEIKKEARANPAVQSWARATQPDALIAATALVHGLEVVTRNAADFERAGVTLCNPWAETPS